MTNAPLEPLLAPELAVLTAMDRPSDLERHARLARWDVAVPTARRHRLLGQLATALERIGYVQHLPPQVQETLAAELRRRRQYHDQRLLPQLQEVCRALVDAQITPVLLKGAAMVCDGILDPAHRPMGDLDLLVDPTEVDRASQVLRDLGYTHRVSAETARWARRHHYQDPPWRHPRRAVPVEIHWDLARRDDRVPLSAADLDRTPVDLPDGTQVARLDDQGLVTHLALHFWRDRRSGAGQALGQLWDVHRAAERLTPSSLTALCQAAVQRGHGQVLATVLAIDALLLGVASERLPAAVTTMMGDERVADLCLARVVTPRPAHLQLLMVTGTVDYSLRRVVTRVASELRRPTSELRKRYGDHPSWRLHLRHHRAIFGLLGRVVRTPRQSFHQVRLDRWGHTLR